MQSYPQNKQLTQLAQNFHFASAMCLKTSKIWMKHKKSITLSNFKGEKNSTAIPECAHKYKFYPSNFCHFSCRTLLVYKKDRGAELSPKM